MDGEVGEEGEGRGSPEEETQLGEVNFEGEIGVNFQAIFLGFLRQLHHKTFEFVMIP